MTNKLSLQKQKNISWEEAHETQIIDNKHTNKQNLNTNAIVKTYSRCRIISFSIAVTEKKGVYSTLASLSLNCMLS